MTARKDLGFTLIEVITVVMIIAILAAIAIPSYQNMMRRTRRAEAVTIINDQQLRLEKFRVDHADYNDYVPTGMMSTPFYTIAITNGSPSTYTLTASPKQGPQANDSCGDLVLTFNAGVITRSDDDASEGCW